MQMIPQDTPHVAEDAHDSSSRRAVLNLLRKVPELVHIARNLAGGDVFRVVMSEKNAHLFKQAKDGTWKPFLRDSKGFVENVDLVKAPPDFARAVSDLNLMVNLAAIAAKLETIQRGIDNIQNVIANTQRGKVKGSLDGLALAREFSLPAERRLKMIDACQDIVIELGGLVGQLHSHTESMPNETTGFFEGFFGSKQAEAGKAYQQVQADVDLLTVGVGQLLRAYEELGEPTVARTALAQVVGRLKEVRLSEAVRKARLLPYSRAGVSPEDRLAMFQEVFTLLQTRIVARRQDGYALLSVDVRPEELTC